MKALKITFMAMLLWISGMAQQYPEPKPTDMELSISMKKRMLAQGLIINVEYRNTSARDIRLINEFHDGYQLSLTMIRVKKTSSDPPQEPNPDGSWPIKLFRPPLALVTFMHPGPEGFRYIAIKPGHSFKYEYNLSKALRDYVWPAGDYELYMTYGNVYGENCIKGYGYKSNTVAFTVVK